MSKNIVFYRKRDYLLVAFLFITFVSCLINIKYGGLGDNIRALIWTCNLFFLVYMVNPELDKNYIKKEITLFSNLIISLWFTASTCSLIMFVLNMEYTVRNFNGTDIRQGFVESRLHGVFMDPNDAAVISVVVIILSLMQFIFTSSKFLKILYILSIVVQFSYLVLSWSRTAEYSLVVVAFFGSFILLKKYIKFNKAPIFLKYMLIIFISILNCVLIIFLINVLRTGFSYIPMLFNKAVKSNGNSVSKMVMERNDVSENSDISNNRFAIWSSALEIFKSTPVLGTSPRSIISYAKDILSEGYIAKRSYALHNGYLNILVSTGISGAICMFTFLFIRACSYIKYIFKKEESLNLLKIFYMLPPLAIATSACFLTELCFYNTLSILIFWLFLGYNCSREKNEEIVND